MKKFTLHEITDIIRDRHYMTKERFLYYFQLMHGFDSYKINEYWKVYERFPYWDQRYTEVMEDIIEKVSAFISIIKNGSIPQQCRENTSDIKKKIHYNVNGEDAVLDANFNNPTDIVFYAEILKQGYEISCILDFIEKIHGREEPSGESHDIPVYDGDIFITRDESYSSSREDNIYVCDKGVYKRLLYTKGKGYLRRGEPDYDDGRYNSHVLTCCKSLKKVGNIYQDCSILKDGDVETQLHTK